MIKIRYLVLLLIACQYGCGDAELSDDAGSHTEPVTEMHIKGNVGERMLVGDFEISTTPGGLGMTDELITVAVADGAVDVRFTPGETEVAWFSILNPDGDYLGKGRIVLEPGNFTIEVGGRAERLKIRGDGPLNNALYYSWKEEAQYKELAATFESVVEEYEKLPEGEEKDAYYKGGFIPASMALEAYKTDALAAIALNDSEPVLARLATMIGGLSGDEALARLDELDSVLGESSVVDRYRSRAEAIKQADNISRDFGVGAKAVDFTLPTLDGDELALSDVLAANEYVLLEFWAVWCAPCRAEIPHMKRAYAEYSDKGFEIVSVSLDNSRDDWEILSAEENIPWFNTSDLLGYGSPVIQDYGVLGIPKNYLVNSELEIVAMDLRQELLDEALAERLGTH